MTMNSPLDSRISIAKTSQSYESSASQQKPSLLSFQLDKALRIPKMEKSDHSVQNQEIATTYTLASSGSDSSVSSMVSTSTESSAMIDPETRIESQNDQRRKIFSQYWRKNPLPAPPMAAVSREPKSPLVQHYPSSKRSEGNSSSSNDSKQSSSSSIPIPTSKPSHPTDAARLEPRTSALISASPARRSIFGSCHQQEDKKESFELQGFLSRNKHMTVLSASFDTNHATFQPSDAQMRRRLRSYSCSDTMAAFAAGFEPTPTSSSTTTTTITTTSSTTPRLTSCLRRSNSDASSGNNHTNHHNHNTHSVTFDSQISIISFEPTTSCNVECYTNGSWTDVFDH
mmetsp:Transcript_30159/g.71072  ORF Transcript_30159/g.71072 Transcript_30159/m.71072 type:complete len:342 (-) Transcript_30159:73-1098(-)